MNDIIVEQEIDGVIYKARYLGIGYSMSLNDRLANENSSYQLADILFHEVLVSPRMEIDDFADVTAFSKVFSFLINVVNGNTEKKLSNARLKRRAEEENWALWRLVLSGVSFQAVFGKPFMTLQDIKEANFALDAKIKAEKDAMRKKK